MIVGDLLDLEDLPLSLAWGTADLLDRRVTGVTSTDLQDPARYLQPGELVLSGLVWWKPEAGEARTPDAALRFATSLSSARVAALLAGEGTHGQVPPSLVDACRIHGIPLISIPEGTSFRAVTDRIYLRLWGELSTGSARADALPQAVRQELTALLDAGEPLDRVLSRAVTRLGLPRCAVLSAGGRLIAASGAATEAAHPASDADAYLGSDADAAYEAATRGPPPTPTPPPTTRPSRGPPPTACRSGRPTPLPSAAGGLSVARPPPGRWRSCSPRAAWVPVPGTASRSKPRPPCSTCWPPRHRRPGRPRPRPGRLRAVRRRAAGSRLRMGSRPRGRSRPRTRS
ncbi:hypothetical protein GXW82_23940 [Streptacidiphilus sp. 4-A2]|nr:hypothetical protein [Streptacidiphilus sp. 4-A2]